MLAIRLGLRAVSSLHSSAALLHEQQLLRAAPALLALLSRASCFGGPGLAPQPAPAGAPCWLRSPPRSFASVSLSQQPAVAVREDSLQEGSSSSGSSSSGGGDSPGANGGRALPASAAERLEVLRQLGVAEDLWSCMVERQAEMVAIPPEQTFRVDAQYVGSRINLVDLTAHPELRGHYKRLHKGAAVLALSDRPISSEAEAEGMPLDPYMVAFSYGSVAFFNASPELRERFLQVVKEVATEPVSKDKLYLEEYSISVVPELRAWSQLDPESIKLRALDLRNLLVISQVLAQSVAMDAYASHVEQALEIFCNMNAEMQESQTFAKINKEALLKLVAENNIVMTDIISKLGLHERYDIAWKHVQYGRIWEFLRAELEMDQRFRTLDMKLNLIQDNLKYFLEILQNRKSDTLEWTIIILIAMEIVLTLYDLFLSRLGS